MIKSKRFEWGLYIATALLMLLLLVSHTYNDILVTVRHGMNFWDIILDGKFLEFYNLNITASGNQYYIGVQKCVYNILIYMIFAIWNLPLYLLDRFFHVDVLNNIACLVYSKLMLVAAVIVTVWILNRILTSLGVPQKARKLLLYVYASSSLMISVIFINAQYDILSVIFQLLGLQAFIEKKEKRFIFWFGIAFCFKFFSLFIFLPLLLIRHKRVFAIVKNGVMMAIPWLLTRLPFWLYSLFATSGIVSVSRGETLAATKIIDLISSSTISDNLNLFIVIYALLLVWSYLRDSNSNSTVFNSIFICFATYSAFFGTMNTYPYWCIILAPYVVLAMAVCPKYLYLNLLLETIGMAGLVFKNMVLSPWCYFDKTLKPMVWPLILEGTQYTIPAEDGLISRIMLSLQGPTVPGAIISFFIAAMSAMVYLVYRKNSLPNLNSWERAERCEDLLIIRLGINALVCLLPILAIFI